jgi:cell division septal protein FtsQ
VAKRKQPKQKSGLRSRLMRLFQDNRFHSIVISLVLLTGIFFGIRYFLLNNSFFIIKKVTVNGQNNISFPVGQKKINDLYLGRNILSIDLNHASIMIAESFPQLKKVEVRRVMPSTLDVDVIIRKPVATIGNGNKLMVDREAVVVTSMRPPVNLIRITGLNFFLRKPRTGEKIKAPQIIKALSLLDLLEKKNIVQKYDVEGINVSDRNNMLIKVEGVTVKMGEGDFPQKVSRLQGMLEDPGINMKGVEYIDLRFEEPVIAPR